MKKLFLTISAIALAISASAADPITSQPNGTHYSTVDLSTDVTYFLYNNTTPAIDSNDCGFCTEIVIDDKDVYLKNVIHDFPADYWIKGTTNDEGIVEFQFPQTIYNEDGTEYTLNMLKATQENGLTVYVADENNSMEMQWDGWTLKQISRDDTTTSYRVGLLNKSGNYAGYGFEGLQMTIVTVQANSLPVDVDVTPAEYSCSYTDKNNDAKTLYVTLYRQIDGAGIWIKGLNSEDTNQVICGEINPDGDIELTSGQFTGLTQGYFTYFYAGEIAEGKLTWIESATMHFDGDKIIADNMLLLNQGNTRPILGFSFTDLELTPMSQVSRTPFDPEIPGGDLAPEQYSDSEGMGVACYNIWAVDVDGQALDTSKLFYNLWFDDELQEFEIDGTTTADIPYGYTDPDYMIINMDEYNLALFFETLSSFAVQTVYYNSDTDVTRSNKVTHYFESTSAKNIANTAQILNTRYYNLQGIEIRDAKGVCIKRTEYSDGSVKVAKVRL